MAKATTLPLFISKIKMGFGHLLRLPCHRNPVTQSIESCGPDFNDFILLVRLPRGENKKKVLYVIANAKQIDEPAMDN